MAEAGEAAVAADPVVVEVACNAAADRAEACSAEVDQVAAALVEEATASEAVEAWSVAAVDLAAGFRPKAPPAECSVKAQRWALMAAEA